MNPAPYAVPPAVPPVGQQGQARGLLARLADLVLTSDFKQRRSLKLVLLTAFVHTVSLAMVAYGTMQGMFPTEPARVLACMVIFSTSSFFIVIRTGLNKRFAEPSLGFPQALAAQFLAAGAYAISGPVHAVALMLFALVMVFAMFDMKVGHARALAAYSIGLLAAVIAWRTRTDPTVYILQIEMFYLVTAATVFISISQLATLLSSMRRRLTAQKNELQSALAHIQEMATHDELTGLANRRHILDLLNQHAMRHARGGPSFYVAMADLDHFKQINDAHGHGVGDEALRTFAKQAQAQLRNTDVIGRWGGEEFLLLMPETPPGDPNVGLERLRANLADCPASEQVPELRVRFSAGLSRYRDGEAVGDTIERADRAAYAAKEAGRDRTVAL